jgi:hypothetical protein
MMERLMIYLLKLQFDRCLIEMACVHSGQFQFEEKQPKDLLLSVCPEKAIRNYSIVVQCQ